MTAKYVFVTCNNGGVFCGVLIFSLPNELPEISTRAKTANLLVSTPKKEDMLCSLINYQTT